MSIHNRIDDVFINEGTDRTQIPVAIPIDKISRSSIKVSMRARKLDSKKVITTPPILQHIYPFC